MACSCCGYGDTADQHFDARRVAAELAKYRRKGPRPTTRALREGLVSAGLRGGTSLDIGGGLGILSLELLDAGFRRAVVVDASSAYLAGAQEEATRCFRSIGTGPPRERSVPKPSCRSATSRGLEPHWNPRPVTFGVARDAERPVLKLQFMPTVADCGAGRFLPHANFPYVAKTPMVSVN